MKVRRALLHLAALRRAGAGALTTDVKIPPAIELVVTGPSGKDIPVASPEQRVVPSLAEKLVSTRFAVEDVVSGVAQDNIWAGTGEDNVVPAAAKDDVPFR